MLCVSMVGFGLNPKPQHGKLRLHHAVAPKVMDTAEMMTHTLLRCLMGEWESEVRDLPIVWVRNLAQDFLHLWYFASWSFIVC